MLALPEVRPRGGTVRRRPLWEAVREDRGGVRTFRHVPPGVVPPLFLVVFLFLFPPSRAGDCRLIAEAYCGGLLWRLIAEGGCRATLTMPA